MGIPEKLMRLLQRTLLGLLLAPCLSLAQPVQENAIKAAFVYNFVLFTEWPEASLRGAETINVCVNSASEMQEALLVLNGKAAKGARIKILPKSSLDNVPGQCHVLYIDYLDRHRWPVIRKALGDARVLTITDDADIARNAAMIAMLIQGNRVVFEIDQSAGRQAHLVFSSKLLRLARTVK